MNLYILVGATVVLDEEGAEFYQGTAWEHFRKSSPGFQKAEQLAEKLNAQVRSAGVKVAGNENSDINDIIAKVSVKLREWQPSLRNFNFNVNHFFVGGTGVLKSTNQAFKWVVLFHFE